MLWLETTFWKGSPPYFHVPLPVLGYLMVPRFAVLRPLALCLLTPTADFVFPLGLQSVYIHRSRRLSSPRRLISDADALWAAAQKKPACFLIYIIKNIYIFIYFKAPLEAISALICLLHLSLLLCCSCGAQGNSNLFGGIYWLSCYAVMGSAWMAVGLL